jgi:hypothetical protein
MNMESSLSLLSLLDGYEYDEDEDSGEDDEDIFYEPDEISKTKYNLAICGKYSHHIHGFGTGEAINHFITTHRFNNIDFRKAQIYLTLENIQIINNIINLNTNYNANVNVYEFNRMKPRIEITECIYLPSQHCVSIIKTLWIKLIQRTWKKICKERKLCLIQRQTLNSIKYKEIYGYWPNHCNYYPPLKGMLSYLSRRTFG